MEKELCSICGKKREHHYRLNTCSTKCYLLARQQKSKKGFRYKPNERIRILNKIYEVEQ